MRNLLILLTALAAVTCRGAISPGSSSSSGVTAAQATNIAVAASAFSNAVNNGSFSNAVPANGFFFIGDSLTQDSGNFGVSQSDTWPAVLLRQPNYYWCRTYLNGAIGSSQLHQWFVTSNYFTTAYGSDKVNSLSLTLNPDPIGSHSPATYGKDWLFCFLGYNDTASAFAQITNDLGVAWSQIRASNFVVIASTLPTNTGLSFFQYTNTLNLNAWILSMSNSYYAVMRPELVITNVNLFASDHVHFNTNGSVALAQWISTNLPPPLSSQFGNVQMSPEPRFKTISVTNNSDFAGLRVSGDTGYVPSWGKGGGVEIYYQVMVSKDETAGTYSDYQFRADNLYLFGNSGVQIVRRSNFASIGTPTTNDFFVQGSMAVGDAYYGNGFGLTNVAAPPMHNSTNTPSTDVLYPLISPLKSAALATGTAMTNGNFRAVAFTGVGGLVDCLGVNVTTAAGTLLRFGLYVTTSPTNLWSGTRLCDTGDMDSSVAGPKCTNLTSTVRLYPNLIYWATVHANGAVRLSSLSAFEGPGVMGMGTNFVMLCSAELTNSVYGALPATLPFNVTNVLVQSLSAMAPVIGARVLTP